MSDAAMLVKLRKNLAKLHESGRVTWPQVQMILRTIHISSRRVSDICVPRSEIKALDQNSTSRQVRYAFSETGYSRLLVHKGSIDQLIGILYARDWIHQGVDDDDEIQLQNIVREPVFINEAVPVLDALALMREKKVTIAVCMDEHGSVSGLITLEDIIEEVFDEIEDEYDDDGNYILSEGDGEIVLDAVMPLDDFCRHVNITAPDAPVDTVGGYVSHSVGEIPQSGSLNVTPLGTFTVLHSDGRRLTRLRWRADSE